MQTSTLAKRQQIVDEALTWVGTPYHHQAGLKGVGVDCAYLVGHIAQNVGLIKEFKTAPYSIEWHWHSREERMCNIMEEFGLYQPTDGGLILPGDVLAFQYGRVCSHLGIMLEGNKFIHAHIKAGRVVVNSLDGDFQDRLRRIYRFPNLEE